MKILAGILACNLLLVPGVFAETIAHSGPEKVSLMEVFSSEGCSSCPPAERWVSYLSKNPDLWKKFVPVVFHVDYWDYLGWKDEMADPHYTERQRRYGAAWKANGVYTPCFVLNGKEWQDWYTAKEIPDPKKQAGEIFLEKNADGSITLAYLEKNKRLVPENFRAHLALLAFGLSSNVTAGENEGRRLVHDFTVVAYNEAAMGLTSTGRLEYKLDLKLSRQMSSQKLALAAWVSGPDDQTPLQAAGTYLKNGNAV